MTDEIQVHRFSLVDYVLFGLSLSFSVLVGFYYACTGGKQKSTSEFLFGNRQLGILPVVFSLIASSTSAIGILGFPAEIYTTGAIYSTSAISIIGTSLATAFLFLPVFHALETASMYEYLQLRFHRYVRRMATIIFVLHNFMYMGMCLYGPAIALSQVTGLSIWASMLGTGLITTLYSTIGGIKAIVWTDTFQEILVFLGLMIVIIQGILTAGSFSTVWTIAEKGGRTNFFDFNPDPTIEHSTWSLIIGGFFSWLPIFACQQTMVQRYLSLGKLKKAQIGLMSVIPFFLLLDVLYLFAGWVIYARFADCDPKAINKIEDYAQILPFFVMETLQSATGLPGVFLAAVFSASLSAISSGLNSISAVIVEDIITPINFAMNRNAIADETATVYMKILAAVFGLLTIGLAFMTQAIGRHLYQITIAFDGVFGGPLLGVFCLGIFFPCTNSIGATMGLILSLIFSCWLAMGNVFFGEAPPILPISTSGCSNSSNISSLYYSLNSTSVVTSNISTTHSALDTFYSIAYYHYTFLGAVITITVGLLMSFATKPTKFEDVDPKLLHPWFSKCSQIRTKSSQYGKVTQNDSCTRFYGEDHEKESNL